MNVIRLRLCFYGTCRALLVLHDIVVVAVAATVCIKISVEIISHNSRFSVGFYSISLTWRLIFKRNPVFCVARHKNASTISSHESNCPLLFIGLLCVSSTNFLSAILPNEDIIYFLLVRLFLAVLSIDIRNIYNWIVTNAIEFNCTKYSNVNWLNQTIKNTFLKNFISDCLRIHVSFKWMFFLLWTLPIHLL